MRHGTDAENGVFLDTTGNNFRIFGTPNVGSVFIYNPQTAQLSVGSQHVVRSINGNNADANGNIAAAQTGCLPLTGGYMSGSIRFHEGYIGNGGNELLLVAEPDGNDRGNRSTIALRGPNSTSPGSIALCARTDTSQKYFSVYPNGIITWDGLMRMGNGEQGFVGTSYDSSRYSGIFGGTG